MSDPRGSTPRYNRQAGSTGKLQRRAKQLQKEFKLTWATALLRAKIETGTSLMAVKFTKVATLLSVVFDSTVTLNGRVVSAYSWDYGDGSAKGTTADPTKVFGSAGTRRVRLKVTDTLGAVAYAEQDVTVVAS